MFTTLELGYKSEKELSALFLIVCRELSASEKDSGARTNALASLENISQARALKMVRV